MESIVQTFGIKSCPLCSSCGPEDSPELVDHVLRHTYEFALRALPWPPPILHDLNIPPGSFNSSKGNTGEIPRWINTVAHESAARPVLDLCHYDRADHSTKANVNMPEHSNYFLINSYFDDRSEDKSSRPQANQSITSNRSASTRALTISSVAFSPSLLLVAYASDDFVIRIWDIKTDACVMALHGHEGLVSS
ncbi:hypothetical protein GCG54_00013580 [Colletotrichum gloeosporioides]|uniref:WD domain-containing protein n=1 Tax=Colletotrichum gloeosporioides TaxID=474922 RepID=A0A8H4CLD4_COLGL|nr:uncharacterized protein GCG54_00013580 [Colletotrichum gloeosporioides]KAF3805906.1 hypothetical protein GCG54_00013580 [Colletotrichum gloeosporioides]